MSDTCCPKTTKPFGNDLETGQRTLRPMNAQVGLVASQDRRQWVAIVAVGLSLFLSALDATIVALALPPIASRFLLSDRGPHTICYRDWSSDVFSSDLKAPLFRNVAPKPGHWLGVRAF